MAFDRLEPHRELILRLQADGRTLTDIAAQLSRSKGIETTPATLSRFLKAIGKPQRLKELTPVEERQLDSTAVLAEIVAEVQGRSDEQRRVIETLAGKVAVMAADLAALDKRIAANTEMRSDVTPDVLRRVWIRAFATAIVIVGAVAAVGVFWMLRR